MSIVFDRPKSLTDVPFHYCPGCTHGIIHRLVAETIDELGIEGNTIGIAPVGCAVFAYNYFNCDMIEAAHGRAPAVATGAKRANPDRILFTYQGDGDLAAIGTAETVHAAPRPPFPGRSHRQHPTAAIHKLPVIRFVSVKCSLHSTALRWRSVLQLTACRISAMRKRRFAAPLKIKSISAAFPSLR